MYSLGGAYRFGLSRKISKQQRGLDTQTKRGVAKGQVRDIRLSRTPSPFSDRPAYPGASENLEDIHNRIAAASML